MYLSNTRPHYRQFGFGYKCKGERDGEGEGEKTFTSGLIRNLNSRHRTEKERMLLERERESFRECIMYLCPKDVSKPPTGVRNRNRCYF